MVLLLKGKYTTLVSGAQKLSFYVENDESSQERVSQLDDLTSLCTELRTQIDDSFVNNNDFTDVDALIPLIAEVGTSCIGIMVTNAYFYKSTTNST
ncbi:MAG: hypothetical protein SGARI_006814, partial [Bacillariaceae sp.]